MDTHTSFTTHADVPEIWPLFNYLAINLAEKEKKTPLFSFLNSDCGNFSAGALHLRHVSIAFFKRQSSMERARKRRIVQIILHLGCPRGYQILLPEDVSVLKQSGQSQDQQRRQGQRDGDGASELVHPTAFHRHLTSNCIYLWNLTPRASVNLLKSTTTFQQSSFRSTKEPAISRLNKHHCMSQLLSHERKHGRKMRSFLERSTFTSLCKDIECWSRTSRTTGVGPHISWRNISKLQFAMSCVNEWKW